MDEKIAELLAHAERLSVKDELVELLGYIVEGDLRRAKVKAEEAAIKAAGRLAYLAAEANKEKPAEE